MNKCPCYNDGKDCEKRAPGCAIDCPEWKAFHEARVARNAAIRKKRNEEAMVIGCRVESSRKTSRTKHKQKLWKG